MTYNSGGKPNTALLSNQLRIKIHEKISKTKIFWKLIKVFFILKYTST